MIQNYGFLQRCSKNNLQNFPKLSDSLWDCNLLKFLLFSSFCLSVFPPSLLSCFPPFFLYVIIFNRRVSPPAGPLLHAAWGGCPWGLALCTPTRLPGLLATEAKARVRRYQGAQLKLILKLLFSLRERVISSGVIYQALLNIFLHTPCQLKSQR